MHDTIFFIIGNTLGGACLQSWAILYIEIIDTEVKKFRSQRAPAYKVFFCICLLVASRIWRLKTETFCGTCSDVQLK